MRKSTVVAPAEVHKSLQGLADSHVDEGASSVAGVGAFTWPGSPAAQSMWAARDGLCKKLRRRADLRMRQDNFSCSERAGLSCRGAPLAMPRILVSTVCGARCAAVPSVGRAVSSDELTPQAKWTTPPTREQQCSARRSRVTVPAEVHKSLQGVADSHVDEGAFSVAGVWAFTWS